MTKEELERLDKGKRLATKISKLREFLEGIDKKEITVTFSSGRYARNTSLATITGQDFINNRVVGDIALAVREEIVKLEEEFSNL